jgi:enoyl-CoA hydratase
MGVREGLEYVATWNAGMLMSIDLKTAVDAALTRSKPVYPD